MLSLLVASSQPSTPTLEATPALVGMSGPLRSYFDAPLASPPGSPRTGHQPLMARGHNKSCHTTTQYRPRSSSLCRTLAGLDSVPPLASAPAPSPQVSSNPLKEEQGLTRMQRLLTFIFSKRTKTKEMKEMDVKIAAQHSEIERVMKDVLSTLQSLQPVVESSDEPSSLPQSTATPDSHSVCQDRKRSPSETSSAISITQGEKNQKWEDEKNRRKASKCTRRVSSSSTGSSTKPASLVVEAGAWD